MEEIQYSINCLRRQNFESRYYISERGLYQALSEVNIRKALQHATVLEAYELEDLVKFVMKGARKILGVLILIGHVAYIKDFVGADQFQSSPLDHRLPFELQKLNSLLRPLHAQLFHEKQWEVISPVFSESVLRRQLEDQTILPFSAEKIIGRGGFGTVYKVELDAEQNMYSHDSSAIVRKELLPDSNDYQNELMNLSSLNLLKHPHIVQLLGSYTHRKRHNFIFPQARGGCLQDLFEQERPREFIKDEDVLVALSRLASAISHVHDFFVQDFSLSKIGCHHDLRPSNILVDEDRFILADFGLSRFKEQNDGSATEFKIGKGYCLAPECQDLDNDFERHEIHRSSDIWSFGCIVADLLTWMVKGPSGITEFKQKRRTTIGNHIYYYFHSGLCANPGVEKWLADLENTCATSVKMLISLTRRMLDIEPDLRPSAKEVAVYTRFIALNAIFLRTSQNFQDIQQRSFNPEASIEPLVESRRFSSWGWALEIDSDTIHIPKSSPQIDLGFDGFQSAISLLRMLRLELDSIKSQAPNGYKRILMPLRHINTSLMKLLPHHAQARAIRYVEREVLQTESPIQLEKLQHVYPNDHIKVLASARKSTLFIGSVSQYKERALEMQHEPVLGTSQLGHHIIGSLHPISSQDTCQVLVELKSYEDPFLRERLFHRMEGIARLSSSIPKPDKLRILHCRGYFHDKVRSAFGLVYDFPTLAISNGQKSACSVVSLRHILDAQLRNQQPTLGQRFKLAYDLASAISSFGKIGWFHKGLSSSAIAFFYQQESSFEASSMDPYLIGFRHSRPHDIVTFTEGPSAADPDERYYQHPQYLQENVPYSFIHEYYSLGVVLLEIGLWKPVMKMTKLGDLVGDGLRTRIVETVVPRLGQSMGIVYRNVVLSLLDGNFGKEISNHDSDQKSARTWFDSTVLNELFQLSALKI